MIDLRQERRFELALTISSALVMALFFAVARPNVARSTARANALWKDIHQAADSADLEPSFVYAICMAESSLNPKADSGYARGLMQLSRVAWKEVSNRPYREAYQPRANVEVGVQYLGHLRAFLQEHDAFSYARLAACYRYGPYEVKDAGFDVSRLPPPKNTIYQALFHGDTDPVPVPTPK